MKIINHIEEDPVVPTFLDDSKKWLDNRQEPIVRIGGEVFESHYRDECKLETYITDPRRSFVRPLYHESKGWIEGLWPVAELLICFLRDLGFDLDHPAKAMSVAFWTMFPECVWHHLSASWNRDNCFNSRHFDVVRVINNPFFYCDSNAAESRLLEIAQDGRCTYAIDLANETAPSETLAREIALLNHIHEGDAAVAAAYSKILPQISDILS